MSKKFFRFIQIGVVGIWLCLVSVLLYKHYISGVEFTPLQSLTGDQFKTSEEWFGIYLKGRKIGYLKSMSEKIGNEYRFMQTVETDVETDGKTSHSRTIFKCLTDLEYRLKSFEYDVRSEGMSFKSRGELDKDNVLQAFMEKGEHKKTETIDIKGQLFLSLTIKQMLFAQGIEKGKRFNIPVLNIFSMKVEDTVVEVQELIPVKVGINVNTAYKLKIGESLSWISDRGNTMKEEPFQGLVYFAESESEAKSKDNKQIFDFLSLPVLLAEKQLSNTEALSYFKVRLSGFNLDEYPLLNGGRQVLRGDVLEIKREKTEALKEATYDLPYADKDMEPFLSPTPFAQSDHHTIVYNAKKFLDIEKHAFRLARFLTSNLYMSTRKRPMSQLNTSMDLFKTRVGESNEHTVLFAAFARATGMPTRMVGGLVYRGGYFYYHAWIEAWFGRWVPADPTLSQFPADVTHIRFLEGDIDKIASFGGAIKNIRIDIIEAL